MQLGRLGVWASMDGMTAAAAASFAQRVEGGGYGTLWLPESRGRNVLVIAGWLLANTRSLIVATGIANIYARDPQATASGQLALAEQSGGRFLELANYRNNLLRLGFAASDFASGGSDRLVDAVIAWGDAAAIRRRVDEHWAAGADHVCIQALNPDETTPALPDERLLTALA